MAMSVAVIMTTMSVSVIERENTDQVDQQSDKTDQQQSMCVHLWRIHQPLNGFRYDTDRDQYQEHSVCESAQRLHSIVPETGE